jgi:hypothetical protein
MDLLKKSRKMDLLKKSRKMDLLKTPGGKAGK